VNVLSADFVTSATEAKGYPAPGAPEVAFCGRSNVGKSSCLNALAGRHSLARVSRTPGRTRLINFFDLRLAEQTRSGGRGREHALRLVDLPGYGYAAGPRGEKETWREMIERFLVGRETLRALVVLVDGELGPQESDAQMIAWGRALPPKLFVVATKLDKLARTRRAQRLERIAAQLALPGEAVLGFSAKERFGVDELWRRLVEAAENGGRKPEA
jgi:GTP-binding protein